MNGKPLLAFVCVVGVSAPVAAQRPTFASRLEAVRVDVLVTDRGQIVRGLQAADFEIRDNGVLQSVDLVSFQEIPLNVILALDVSASVAGERLDHLQAAGSALLNGLRKGDRAALVTFSQQVAFRERLTPEIQRVGQALLEVVPRGDTALIDGSHAAMLLADPGQGRSLLLVFSDGLDTSSFLSPAGVLESARRSDIVVYGVSTRGSEREFLSELGDLTGGALFEIETTKDLSSTFIRILNEFRQRYLVSYSPRGVSKAGWHRLDVRIKGRRAMVKARAGYQAGS